MNKVFLIGRLTRDPELRYTGNNTPVASFPLLLIEVLLINREKEKQISSILLFGENKLKMLKII